MSRRFLSPHRAWTSSEWVACMRTGVCAGVGVGWGWASDRITELWGERLKEAALCRAARLRNTCVTHRIKLFKNPAWGRQLGLPLWDAVRAVGGCFWRHHEAAPTQNLTLVPTPSIYPVSIQIWLNCFTRLLWVFVGVRKQLCTS